MFRHQGAPGGFQLLPQRDEFLAAVDLQAQVIDAGGAAGGGDREVDAGILEHPFRVVGLEHAWLGAEQLAVEADAAGKVGDIEMHMEALHRLAPGWRGVQLEAGPQFAAPAQQFSVR